MTEGMWENILKTEHTCSRRQNKLSIALWNNKRRSWYSGEMFRSAPDSASLIPPLHNISSGLTSTNRCSEEDIMRRLYMYLFVLCTIYQIAECGVRRKRQAPPQIPQIANGELITSIFQIPIQTLGAVRDLLQTTRGRIQAVGQAYQALMAAHPNHRPNPHFAYDTYSNNYSYNNFNRPQYTQNNRYQNQNYNRRRVTNSKALAQPRENSLHIDDVNINHESRQ